ncbi:DUF4870 domain-containing protein [Streptomonospora sp. PA3]|uniref:DUF4870 domain-containing protein n=1 Tax=Streptomonospora sp. PA3 TaxID=2607326 RepID=UPI0012DE7F92|nr:DUF4870 domain-containing protein [Streptomonospora sp. PA3]MUL40191.1 DUF4870 domain-containing protein [Streptomonospora sp. PA3]
MSYPPQPDQPYGGGQQPGGYPNHPGGYNPPPGYDPNYGPPSGPQPGYGPQSGPQPGYGQPQYPAPVPYQQGYGQPGGYGAPSSDDRTMGMAAHIGGLFTGFLLPLILYLVKKDESPFIRHQSAQAFNFQVTMAIGYIVSSILMIVIIGIFTLFAVLICSVIFAIMAGVAANKGEWYEYPKWLAFPMMK